MGMPISNLRRVVNTLEKTWQAWWEETDPNRKKKLENNFEYLLAEAHTFLGYVDEEWRGAFTKPSKTPEYDQKLQHDLVNDFVPEYDRKKKAL
jgi:hypothetical protein